MKTKTIALLAADALVGAGLVTAFIATGTFGLSQASTDFYDDAVSRQSFIDTIGFPNFRIADYPVSFFCAGKEYVMYEGTTTKRKPVYGVSAATSQEVNGRQEVFMPCLDEWYVELRVMMASAGELSIDQEILDAYAMATFWHESFHGWQATRLAGYREYITAAETDDDLPEGDPVLALDASAAYRQWYTADYQLLVNAVAATADERKGVLQQWVAHQDAFPSDVNESLRHFANFYEVSEGGARYVKEKVFINEVGQARHDEYFKDKPTEYINLSGKYYNTGSLKAQILDLISPGWQASFTFVLGGFDPYITEAVAKLP